jgi:2-methylcitrate dehydratase PrpD
MSAGLAGKIPTGLTSRWLTLGCALQNGLTASLAAEAGFLGDSAVLDGLFPSVYGLDLDTKTLLDGLGENWQIDAMSLKPYCTARQTLSPLEAFRRLLDTHHIDPESIEEIQITIPQQYSEMINHPSFPESRIPSIVSVQYQMALAAFYEEGLYDIQRKEMRDDDRIHNFMSKAKVTTSPEYTSLFPGQWPGKIMLKTGTDAFELEILDPLGSPDQPMNWRDVEQKIKRVTKGILDPSQVENLSSEVKGLRGCQSLHAFVDHIPVISLAG